MRRMYSKPQLLEAVEQESKINGIKVFENIVDKDGHKRFIEGDITATISHFNITYGKWALSGTHLLIVVAGNIETDVASYVDIDINLPAWIFDKIYPIAQDIIFNTTYQTYAEGGTTATKQLLLKKATSKLQARLFTSLPENYPYFRCALDLLIDNE